jgi:hypothetical protein
MWPGSRLWRTLRNAIQNESGKTLGSHEDAVGAAAGIEQLWAAARIILGRTDGDLLVLPNTVL